MDYHIYKYEYPDGTIEYKYYHSLYDHNMSLSIERACRANKITNITSGFVVKDRYSNAPRYVEPEPHQIFDDGLFKI